MHRRKQETGNNKIAYTKKQTLRRRRHEDKGERERGRDGPGTGIGSNTERDRNKTEAKMEREMSREGREGHGREGKGIKFNRRAGKRKRTSLQQ